MAKWVFYLLVFVYMCYRAVYGVRVIDTSISVEQIHYDKEENYLEVGTRKTVACRAPNKNQRLEWVDPFGNVVKRIASNRVYAQEHFVSSPKGSRTPGLVLTFSELKVNDTGVYQCKSGEQTKSVRVCVIKPAEFVDSDDTPTEVSIEAGRAITLACQANGDPEPKLLWTRNDEELKEGVEHPKYKVNRRFKIQGYESLLTITSVGPEDAGEYYCVAMQESRMLDNCTAYDFRNITLQVNYEPTFSRGDSPKYVYGKNNEIVDIKCLAIGWPKPTYRWFKDLGGGELYEFDKSKIVFSEEPNAAVLSVTAGPTTYGNIYKCTASNVYGDTDEYFKLLRREKPLQADHMEPILINSNSVHFNVSWVEPVFFPVDSYSIQYVELSDAMQYPIDKQPNWRKPKQVAKVIDHDEEDDDEDGSSGIIVELDGLKPETEYVARFRAENEAGTAPWSDAVEFTTTAVSESETEEKEDAEETDESEDKITTAAAEVGPDTGMFYGIFFTGGILIVAVVCMFVMRLV